MSVYSALDVYGEDAVKYDILEFTDAEEMSVVISEPDGDDFYLKVKVEIVSDLSFEFIDYESRESWQNFVGTRIARSDLNKEAGKVNKDFNEALTNKLEDMAGVLEYDLRHNYKDWFIREYGYNPEEGYTIRVELTSRQDPYDTESLIRERMLVLDNS